MARGHSQKRRVSHRVVSRRNAFEAIRYTLTKTARRGKAAEEGQTAYARILAGNTVDEAQMARELAATFPGLQPHVVEALLAQWQDLLLGHLKAGRRVTFKNAFSFGAAFEGCVDPEHPFDARLLPLSPWVRFAPEFLDRMNRSVEISYDAPLLPPKIQVTSARWDKAHFVLSGNFRNVSGLVIDLITERGEEIPCSHTLNIPGSSRRPSGKQLFVSAAQLLPCDPTTRELLQPCTLRLQWFDGANEEKTQSFLIEK